MYTIAGSNKKFKAFKQVTAHLRQIGRCSADVLFNGNYCCTVKETKDGTVVHTRKGI